MPDVHLLWLEAPGLAATAQPGQFVMVRCGEEVLLRRPLAVHRVHEDQVALLVRQMGQGTRWLCARQPGEVIDLLGPLGNGFRVDESSRRLLLIAGGMGIAPITFLAEWVSAGGKEVTICRGAHTADALYPLDQLSGEARVMDATDDGTAGTEGAITILLAQQPRQFDQVFAAGPLDMYRALQQGDLPVLRGKSVQVTLEVRMGCGFGCCLGCAIPTQGGMKLACRDGPIFPLEEVNWQELGQCP